MHVYCTYFDRKFLPRALALHASLRQWAGDFHLWALCLDDESYRAVCSLGLPAVTPISLAEFEGSDPDLRRARQDRSLVEYYYTCSPSLPLFVLDRCPEAELVTYLDADLFFYSDPRPLFDELDGA